MLNGKKIEVLSNEKDGKQPVNVYKQPSTNEKTWADTFDPFGLFHSVKAPDVKEKTSIFDKEKKEALKDQSKDKSLEPVGYSEGSKSFKK